MSSAGFQLRWSWRDLRSRWVQIAVIALIIALGTGGYAGLISSVEWREESATASFDALNMYDLRVKLASGSYVPEGSLTATLATLEDANFIEASDERFISLIQSQVVSGDDTIIGVGPLVGVDVSDGGPQVAGISISAGRGLTTADSGQDVVLVSEGFASYNDLPDSGQLMISGNRELTYVGQALSPEYFSVLGGLESGSFVTQSSFTPLYTSLATAQNITGREGMVNDLVLTLEPGADRESIANRLEAALERDMPETGFQIMSTEDDPSYQVIFDDINGDRQMLTVFALLIFLGAVGASFNLTSRFIEAQRREIGIAMALGVPRRQIALRPLLVGAEIALLGVIFGIAVGLILGAQMQQLIEEFQPLPVRITDFQTTIFAQAAVIGFVAPFLATAVPVVRAVRVPPIQAIRTGHLASRGGGLAPVIVRLPIPGSIFSQIPFRNVLRAPRRSLLTVLGIAAAITVMVALIGTLDVFFDAIERSDEATIAGKPDRTVITLAGFQEIDSPAVEAIASSPSVGAATPSLQLGGYLIGDDDQIEVLTEILDVDNDVWTPTLEEGTLAPDSPGIIISRKAADDLGVGIGDTITLRHPQRTGPSSFTIVDTRLPVTGIHTNPFRTLVYLDMEQADLYGLDGVANVMHVLPAPGATADQVRQEMFALDTVTLAQSVGDISESIRDLFESFTSILQTFEGIALLLALLIAFNAASINLDERARDYATMFAFGIPVRTVIRMTMVESGVLGIVGTLFGVLGGFVVIGWVVNVTAAETLEDFGLEIVFEPQTMALAAALGILAVAAAPLLTLRKLRRMDIPSTLRVME
ncbi:MAG: FtsX-like permease family protein [Thermomicrobiales bacterium]